MKYDHAVIYKGKFYAAGSEVPVKAEKPKTEVEKPEKKEEKKVSKGK